MSRTPPTTARGGPAPHAGKIVVPEGAAHGYELVEQLTALPQQRVHGGRSSSLATLRHGSPEPEGQPGDWGGDDAPVQRWLDAGASGGIEGFCAADLHPAVAFPQLAPAALALVEVLAGLPMRFEEPGTAAGDASLEAAAAQLQHRDRSSSHSGGRDQGGQDLQDYSLQDSFARGHFGEGRAASSTVCAGRQPHEHASAMHATSCLDAGCRMLGAVAAVWRGVRRVHSGAKDGSGGGGGQHFVLKRLMVEHGMEVNAATCCKVCQVYTHTMLRLEKHNKHSMVAIT